MWVASAAVVAVACLLPCPAPQSRPAAPDAVAVAELCLGHPRAWSHLPEFTRVCIDRLDPFEAAGVRPLLFVGVR